MANRADHTASTSNHLYIKSVSPLATEQSVTEFLRQAQLSLPLGDYHRRAKDDEDLSLAASEMQESAARKHTELKTVADDIETVQFIQYPGSTLRYCQITFKTSAGVTSAMSMNGHLLLGVPTSLSVIDPAKLELLAAHPSEVPSMLSGGNGLASAYTQNVLVQALTVATVQALIKETQAIHTGAHISPPVLALKSLFLSIGGISTEQASGLVACASAAASAADEAGVGFAATQANILSAIAKAAGAMTGSSIDVIAKLASAHLPRESEEEQVARTLFVKCVPDEWEQDQLIFFLREILALGTIRDKKIDFFPSTGKRFALVEFAQVQAVEYACALDEERRTVKIDRRKVDGAREATKTEGGMTESKAESCFVLEFEPAKTTVRPREPDNVSFNLNQAVMPPVPIAYQSVNQLTLDQKLQEARSRAVKLIALRNATASGETGRANSPNDSMENFDRKSHMSRRGMGGQEGAHYRSYHNSSGGSWQSSRNERRSDSSRRHYDGDQRGQRHSRDYYYEDDYYPSSRRRRNDRGRDLYRDQQGISSGGNRRSSGDQKREHRLRSEPYTSDRRRSPDEEVRQGRSPERDFRKRKSSTASGENKNDRAALQDDNVSASEDAEKDNSRLHENGLHLDDEGSSKGRDSQTEGHKTQRVKDYY